MIIIIIRMATGFRLGTIVCQPHICVYGTMVDSRGLHSLACCKSAPRSIRHSQLNDLIWRAIKKAQIPASKEPTGFSRSDGKRPDVATLVPWSRGKPAYVTVPDTYAASHIQATAIYGSAAAEKASDNKRVKYNDLATMPILYPSLWKQEAHGALNLISLLKISEGESLQSPMNPFRQLTFTRGFPCHSNETMP